MRQERAARRAIHLLRAGLLTAGVLWISACSAASALQSATLSATFTPEQLGRGTTISFGFHIIAPANQVPSPLTAAEISYPVELGFALSELGLATCSNRTLAIFGPHGCPANSVMGYGTALAEIPFGPSIADETASVTILRGQDRDGHIMLLFYVNAASPVSEQIVFPSFVLSAPAPYGGRLAMSVPLVAGLPEGPDAALVQFASTLGPQHLRYRQRVRGQLVEYEPKGIPLPDKCPAGGFQFSAVFTFQDESRAQATTAVPCPRASPPPSDSRGRRRSR